MGQADYLELGTWNAICYNCGRKRKSSELVKTWQGFYVCPEHVGITRHPQDFVRGIPDNQAAPWSQPPGADTFTGPGLFLATEDDIPIFTEDTRGVTE